MRPIDAELLEVKTKLAISMMKLTAKVVGISDEEETKALIEAYETFLDVVTDSPTAEPYKWIPVEDRLPKINTHVLISRKEWPYPTPDDGDRVFKGMRRKDPRSGKEIWWCYGPGYMADEDVLAWMPLPESYRGKEGEK